MSIPRITARAGKPAPPIEPAVDKAAADARRKAKAGADETLHVVYVSGGVDLEYTIAHVQHALDKQGLRHASVIADASSGSTSEARKQALLDRLRALFERGLIGPDTCVVVQLHGGAEADGFRMEATGVIDNLPWEELRATLRHPTGDRAWHGDVILGCCEAARLENALPTNEGTYVLLAGKKSLASGALREQLTSLFDFVGSHIRKKHRMPGSEKTWQFLTQISGENIRRVDAQGITRTKAGEVYVRKPRAGETGKRAMAEAHARQPSQMLMSKLVHGKVASVARVLREHGKQALKDVLLDEIPPLAWLALSERDTMEKVALLFAAGQTDISFGDGTLLHVACLRGDPVLLQALLAQDVNIDQRDSQQRTALHIAAASGQTALASLLLEHGARARLIDAEGKTPLDHAREGGHAALVDLLLKQRRGAK